MSGDPEAYLSSGQLSFPEHCVHAKKGLKTCQRSALRSGGLQSRGKTLDAGKWAEEAPVMASQHQRSAGCLEGGSSDAGEGVDATRQGGVG